jgi:cyclophilin family peptidyl-prolyl cis-trans isomerase
MTFASTLGAQPTFQTIPQTALLGGSPIHIPLDGRSPSGQALSFTAVSSDPLVTPTVLTGNRSLRIHVTNFGVMVFELFDGRARRATNRIAALATSGFYNGVIFHRIINDFVLQGGDPTGTGTGGSTLGRFDDKFHVDLQHNRTGLLSMAKSGDDTNDSQFFITEGPQRHLDFNHSIFGILVEGEAVRERISNVATGPDERPITDVVMESVESFTDTQNAVLMLKAPEGATGAVDITVTVRNASGAETQQTFRVNVTPDLVNSAPFLADVEDIETPVNTAVTYQLIAHDAEGDPALFLDQTGMTENGLQVPVVANENLQYVVEFETGLMTVTPTNGLSGRHQISIATAVNVNAVDYQVVPVVIGPPPEDP